MALSSCLSRSRVIASNCVSYWISAKNSLATFCWCVLGAFSDCPKMDSAIRAIYAG